MVLYHSILWKGYANEVGEAFRSLVSPSWVRFSYAVATSYVLVDTVDKTLKENAKATNLLVDEETRMRRLRLVAADTLVWQMLASVVIPGFTINRACAASAFALARLKPNVAPVNRAKMVTTFGLCLIPFIVKPIDAGVDWFMNAVVRPCYTVEVPDANDNRP